MNRSCTRLYPWPLCLIAALALSACQTPTTKPEAEAEPAEAGTAAPVDELPPIETPDGTGGIATSPYPPGGRISEGADEGAPGAADGVAGTGPLDDPDSLLAQRVIYFDYDNSTVRDRYLEVLTAHAGYLSSHPEARVSLEGHADERGSREYNLALAERRADAVAQLLLYQGAFPDQTETVSYGEERPVALGHNEAAWELNRRVEIIYLNR